VELHTAREAAASRSQLNTVEIQLSRQETEAAEWRRKATEGDAKLSETMRETAAELVRRRQSEQLVVELQQRLSQLQVELVASRSKVEAITDQEARAQKRIIELERRGEEEVARTAALERQLATMQRLATTRDEPLTVAPSSPPRLEALELQLKAAHRESSDASAYMTLKEDNRWLLQESNTLAHRVAAVSVERTQATRQLRALESELAGLRATAEAPPLSVTPVKSAPRHNAVHLATTGVHNGIVLPPGGPTPTSSLPLAAVSPPRPTTVSSPPPRSLFASPDTRTLNARKTSSPSAVQIEELRKQLEAAKQEAELLRRSGEKMKEAAMESAQHRQLADSQGGSENGSLSVSFLTTGQHAL